MTATTSNDAEEAVRWDVADGSLLISCERDGSIWISSATPEGQTWIRMTAAQARGMSNLLWRFAAIADARRARRNEPRPLEEEHS